MVPIVTAAQHNMKLWRDAIEVWYPEYKTKAYFVPPVNLTRIPFDRAEIPGLSSLSISKTKPRTGPDSSDTKIKEDLSVQLVNKCLRVLARVQNETMFVISRLQFSSYLKRLDAATSGQILRPKDVDPKFKSGDFDLLLIHRHYGLLTGEIKSVYAKPQHATNSMKNPDSTIASRIRDAVKEVDNSEIVLHKITEDLEPNLLIRKTLVLPYIRREDLHRVLKADPKLLKDVIRCLKAVDVDQAVDMCLLEDNLDAKQGEWNVSQVQSWWQKCVAVKQDPTMTLELYLSLLARFCGPATTVFVWRDTKMRLEIKTEGEGISLFGERMMSFVLTPEQANLLDGRSDKVFLTGPPGGGKSVMLALMGIKWQNHGYHVNVVSVDRWSLSISRMIKHMIEMNRDKATESPVGSVLLHEFNFDQTDDEADKAISILSKFATRNKGLKVICDEFYAFSTHTVHYHRFITQLCTRHPDVFLWVASPYNKPIPKELKEEKMTIPLRCPPVVQRQVDMAVKSNSLIYSYTTTALASPGDGSLVTNLKHCGSGHSVDWPVDCELCGKNIGKILKQLVKTGQKASSRTSSSSAQPQAQLLQYSDVFILTGKMNLEDECMHGRRVEGAVRGLRALGIPVLVITNSKYLTDMVEGRDNKVTVAGTGHVYSLERKVVVWLPHRMESEHVKFPELTLQFTQQLTSRFFAMSRCTAHLVIVEVPHAKAVLADTRISALNSMRQHIPLDEFSSNVQRRFFFVNTATKIKTMINEVGNMSTEPQGFAPCDNLRVVPRLLHVSTRQCSHCIISSLRSTLMSDV